MVRKSPLFAFFMLAILGALLSRYGPWWIGLLFSSLPAILIFSKFNKIITLSIFFFGISYLLMPPVIPDGTYFIIGRVRQSSGKSVNISNVKIHTPDGWMRVESTYIFTDEKGNAPEVADLFMGRIEKKDGILKTREAFWTGWPSNIFDTFMKSSSNLSNFIYKEFKIYVVGSADTMASVFLGRRDVPYNLKEMYKESGYAQIFAVSGANIWIIAIMALIVLGELVPMNTVKYPLTLLIIFVYGAVTGFSVPTVRAVMTFGIFSFFRLIDRNQNLLNVLGLVGLIEVIRDGSIIFDPSFQLSYSAVIGMIILIPILPQFKPRYISQAINASLAANIGIAPFLILNFGKLYIASFPFNAFIVPVLMTIIVEMGLIFSFFALAGLTFFETIIGAGITPFLKALDWMAYFTKMLPLSTIDIPSKVVVFWITFSILSAFLFFVLMFWQDNQDRSRISSIDDLSP